MFAFFRKFFWRILIQGRLSLIKKACELVYMQGGIDMVAMDLNFEREWEKILPSMKIALMPYTNLKK